MKRQTPARPVCIATCDTRHFSFMAVGETEDKALRALLRGWRKHCKEYTGASENFIREDDISVTRLVMGGCARDHTQITP